MHYSDDKNPCVTVRFPNKTNPMICGMSTNMLFFSNSPCYAVIFSELGYENWWPIPAYACRARSPTVSTRMSLQQPTDPKSCSPKDPNCALVPSEVHGASQIWTWMKHEKNIKLSNCIYINIYTHYV